MAGAALSWQHGWLPSEATLTRVVAGGGEQPTVSEAKIPQSGSLSSTSGVFVMLVAPLPFAFNVQMSASLSNAIRMPSGDQVGCEASAPLPPCWVAPEPSAFIVQIRFARVNAILVPSGDHDGSKSALFPPLPDVMFAAPDPSAFMTPMSEFSKPSS